MRDESSPGNHRDRHTDAPGEPIAGGPFKRPASEDAFSLESADLDGQGHLIAKAVAAALDDLEEERYTVETALRVVGFVIWVAARRYYQRGNRRGREVATEETRPQRLRWSPKHAR
ncbi:hypothetical protein [Pseudonocardia adelaidensis]|uniref:Uncharacterized protein n=1 Tax=Pseudonocardia adelaidensis TaxID=648754 RepID=A0ABP9NA03_9PSEU